MCWEFAFLIKNMELAHAASICTDGDKICCRYAARSQTSTSIAVQVIKAMTLLRMPLEMGTDAISTTSTPSRKPRMENAVIPSHEPG